MYQKWVESQSDKLVQQTNNNQLENNEKTFLSKWKSFIRNESTKIETEHYEEENVVELPDTEMELKQYFLDKIFRFQLKWATSTVTNISLVDQAYYEDPLLQYLLQRFPDTFLLLYYPSFNIKHAPMDAEIIMISPLGIEILYFVEKGKDAIIMAGNERTWTVETPDKQTRMLSPVIALKRTESVVKSILHKFEIDFPIKKKVLSRTNQIIYHTEPYHTEIIGKHDYLDWFNKQRSLSSPLKNRQLKTADVLLKHCQSNSVKRSEWENDTSYTRIGDMEE
ncbi:NERD domain-containing protein [Oceanobacillus piezotolerans]|uniref:NERD domain-containing protein n=1 Tax=Oceanobacillus piezotolerans TaxID=2448030 RepID=UPI001FEA1B68|nr:NERD domain-containing protein [Oceanobacillus piezotolerans]